MTLNEEKTIARLQINGDLDSAELDTLVRKLALLRAEMTPAVPVTREELEQSDASVLIEDKPGLVIAARRDGGFRLWLRHRGLGWLGYQIDDQTASGMANYISHRSEANGVNLFNDQVGNTH